MNLDAEQQELLSAFLDGEVNEVERALVNALLQRPEARQYLEGLMRYRALVRRHATPNVPAGFAAGVVKALEGDYGDISRPNNSIKQPAGKVITLPTATWRTPFVAAAAAMVVAAGLLLASALFNPQTPHTGTIARERALRNTPAADESVCAAKHFENYGDERAGGRVNDASNDPVTGSLDRARRAAREAGDPVKNPSDNDKDITEAMRDAVEAKKLASGKKTAGGGDKKGDGGGAPRPPESPGVASGVPPALKGIAQGEQQDAKADNVFRLAEAARAGTEVNLVMNRDASALQVYTDMLRVSRMYGEARLQQADDHNEDRAVETKEKAGNDFTDYEGIEIEVPEDQVDELLAALDRLSSEQNLGELVVPGEFKRNQPGESGKAKLTDDERDEQPSAPPSDPAAENAPDKGPGRGDRPTSPRNYLPDEIKDRVERTGADAKPAAGRPGNEPNADAPKQPRSTHAAPPTGNPPSPQPAKPDEAPAGPKSEPEPPRTREPSGARDDLKKDGDQKLEKKLEEQPPVKKVRVIIRLK